MKLFTTQSTLLKNGIIRLEDVSKDDGGSIMDIFLEEKNINKIFNEGVNGLIWKYGKNTKTGEFAIRIQSAVWTKLAKSFGVKAKYLAIDSGKKEKITPLKEYLKKGNAVLLSVFSSKSNKGHIVRLQEINDEGIIVDDPYGDVSERLEVREKDGSGYLKKGVDQYDTRNNHDKSSDDFQPKIGEDNLWKWDQLKKTKIKYAFIYSK
ncbi:hypothetical protein [Flammeovirga kamogawensis]|uniref:Peptidase C39-like domain-containing protein n=1 Tax=Flammeovirga kamogawensis TaxID=373891 RepID=A0ABX8GQC9_9BACT|nr:hypothetical protein [Flammeovirga kamogawensis]MBB6463450.1 hypothetical protein [Flammeovirga kamogawensis]QWG05624.1 hypothetical protein KM029_09530 [Flammeovirga kamogawensis]TRX67455.1 hypothetical protein EO216_04565 [Flammeovirga kamogawensis]